MVFGVLLLRVVMGLVMAGHGAQKLFGWFGGDGINGTASFVESLGWRPGRTFALLLGAGEFFGGLAFVLGFLTPFAAAVLIAGLATAAWAVHRPNGLWNSAGGFEYHLVLISAALAVAWTGPGRVSLDSLFGWTIAGNLGGLLALVLGVLGWLGGLAARELAERRVHRPGKPTTGRVH
jgi:putative oxidoreductase